jgi:hypothetical protein
MKLNNSFIILTFMVIIAIIYFADTLSTAATMIATIAGFLAVMINLHKVSVSTKDSVESVEVKDPARPTSVSAQTEVSSEATQTMVGNAMVTPLSRSLSDYTENSPAPYRTYGPPKSEDAQNPNLYGKDQLQYEAYHDAYTDSYPDIKPATYTSAAETDSSFDAKNALLAQKRARDRKCSDGWAAKSANYYKYHYAEELDESESKRWWGNSEW